jgi:hypothetical protein
MRLLRGGSAWRGPGADAAAWTAALAAAVRAAGLPPAVRWTVEVRPRRRRPALSVDEYGRLSVLVPPGTRPAEVSELVTLRRTWILRHAAAHAGAAGRTAPPAVSFAAGETLSLLGHAMRVDVTDTGPVRAERIGGTPTLLVPHAARRDAAAVVGWYCTEGLGWADAQLAAWCDRLALTEAPRVQVRDIGRTRWGVYHGDRHLVRLHWTLFQLPPELAESVLVHELVHATRPPGTPHGPAWRGRMDAALPDWRVRRQRLRSAQAGLWRGAVADAAG